MNITGIFIRRPVMTVLVMMGIVLFGVAGYRSLPVSDLPNVDFPTIQVNASLPGASPETMAASVATPLERQFSTIPGLDSMTSTSARGSTSITLQFTLDRSLDAAAQDVQAASPRPRAACRRDAEPADVPEGQSGRSADPVPLAELADAAALDGRRVRRDADRAAHLDGQRRRAGATSTARRSTPCACSSIPNLLAARGIGIDEVGAALSQAQRQPARPARCGDRARPSPCRPTASS